MTTLREVFDDCPWDRKFQPGSGSCIQGLTLEGLFDEEKAEEAALFVKRHKEETTRGIRALYLFSDSIGMKMAFVFVPW